MMVVFRGVWCIIVDVEFLVLNMVFIDLVWVKNRNMFVIIYSIKLFLMGVCFMLSMDDSK